MNTFFNILIDGLAYGMVLFVIAVGLSVTLGLMRFVNLAHGAFAMMGGYATALLMRGARMVADHLTESWKRQAAVNTAGPVQTLMVTALTPDLSVWAEIDRRLRLSSALEKRELLVQTRHGARLALSFRGTPEQLAVLLRQSDLALTRLADGNWVLALRESPASAP